MIAKFYSSPFSVVADVFGRQTQPIPQKDRNTVHEQHNIDPN
jgi:hypothetical protein